MRWTFAALLTVSVRGLWAEADIARRFEQQRVEHEHEQQEQMQLNAALSARILKLDAAITASEAELQTVQKKAVDGSSLKMSTRELCFRACAPGGGGERWESNTELTATCAHTIQARQMKMSTLEAMEFNEKGTGWLPRDYGAWNQTGSERVRQMKSFMPSMAWRKGNVTWDDVVNNTAATIAASATPFSPPLPHHVPLPPPTCVMGTRYGGSDGIGMNIERTIIGDVLGTLVGCPTKCAPILGRIRHSVVYAHHSDGTTTYCHHAGKSDLVEKKLEMKAIEEYTKTFASNKRQVRHKGKPRGGAVAECASIVKAKSCRNAAGCEWKFLEGGNETRAEWRCRGFKGPTLPEFWQENMRCYNISHFQKRLSTIVPCWSAEVATGLPEATIFPPRSLDGKHDVLTKLFEIPRSARNQVTWNKRVAEARGLIMGVRQQQKSLGIGNGGHPECTFAPPNPPPDARGGGTGSAAGVLTIAVHIRNGDIAMPAMTRLQLCLVRRVCGVLHSKGFRTQVHVYSETHRASPTAAGTFPEFGDMLTFKPRPNGTATPPWCGNGGYHHSLARLRGLPVMTATTNRSNRGSDSAESRFSSALNGVRVTLNGNPLGDIMCMADAEILISGISSSFSGVSAALSSGLKLRFSGNKYRHSGRELREMLWKLIPEDVHLEYDYPQECYDNDSGELSEICKGEDEDWGTCPPMHFDETSFVREVLRRHSVH